MGKGDSERSRRVTVRSEDAPVNTGATAWPSDGEAFVAVRRMQNKLHCWADADRVRRFDDLYNLVCDPKVLAMAWERVAGNKGCAHRRDRPGHRGLDRHPVRGGDVPARDPGSTAVPRLSHRHRCGG